MKSLFRRASVLAMLLAVVACTWDPARPFDREAPQVNEALRQYDAGEAGSAADVLQDYLVTGACRDGNIGTPLRVRERPNGSFDLGLALFTVAEAYGKRFGEEEIDSGLVVDDGKKGLRSGHVECALRVVRVIAEDPAQNVTLRAKAHYLEGNLLFLNAAYKEAVTAYDHALELIPAMGDAGPIGTNVDAGKVTYQPEPIARDAAWNRAVALRRIEDQKDASPPDASPPDAARPDGGKNDNDKDGGKDEKKDDPKDDQNKDAGKKNDPKDDKKDKDKDGGADKPKPDEEKDKEKEPPPPSRQSQDDRILEQLENAPTVQQEAAKKHAKPRRVRGGGMPDK